MLAEQKSRVIKLFSLIAASISFTGWLKMLFLCTVTNSLIEKFKLQLIKEENDVLYAMMKFELAVYDLLQDFNIKSSTDGIVGAFMTRSNYFAGECRRRSLINSEDRFEMIERLSEEIEKLRNLGRDINAQAEWVSVACNDTGFKNLFKNFGTEAMLINKGNELVFVNKAMHLSIHKDVYTSTLYSIFDLKKFKFNGLPIKSLEVYNVIIFPEKHTSGKHLFINECDLSWGFQDNRSEWLEQYLEDEIYQIALDNDCDRIISKIPLSCMEAPVLARKARLARGLWSDQPF